MTENEIKDTLKKLVKRMHKIKNFGLTLMQFQHRYATEHGFKKFKDMCDVANEDMIVEAKLFIKALGE